MGKAAAVVPGVILRGRTRQNKADKSQEKHFRLLSGKLGMARAGLPRVLRLVTGASLPSVQGEAVLPTPANLYSHKPVKSHPHPHPPLALGQDVCSDGHN